MFFKLFGRKISDEATFHSHASKDINESENCSVKENSNIQTLYFKHGQMYKIVGNQDNWYDPKYIVSDGKKYDMECVRSISSIKCPRFYFLDVSDGYGITGSMDYVVQKKAANLRIKGMIAESDACYKKSIKLMKASGIPYTMSQYLYFAKDLLKEGRFLESEKEERKIYFLFKTCKKAVTSDPNCRPYITQEDREYYRIKYFIPESAPKSISSYTRMKRANTVNFQKLCEAAKNAGIVIKQ